MIRIFLLVLLAMAVAGATTPALAGAPIDCPMAAAGMADHEEMGCCTPECAPECAIVCPGAIVPLTSDAVSPLADGRDLAPVRPVDALPSLRPGATDPPPRTTIS